MLPSDQNEVQRPHAGLGSLGLGTLLISISISVSISTTLILTTLDVHGRIGLYRLQAREASRPVQAAWERPKELRKRAAVAVAGTCDQQVHRFEVRFEVWAPTLGPCFFLPCSGGV